MDELNKIRLLIDSFRALLEARQDLSEAENRKLIFSMYDFLDLLEEQTKKPLTVDRLNGTVKGKQC